MSLTSGASTRLALVVLGFGWTGRVSAQSVPPGAQAVAGACAGETITSVDIRVHPATSVGPLGDVSADATRAVRSRLATTRPGVVRAYLRLSAGHQCSELHRRESERLLRAQPFIASASVRAVPDGAGRVRIIVDVTDELSIVVDGGLHGGNLSTVTLGSLNLMGRGLAVSVEGTRGFAYRNGFGFHAVQYGAFGRPYYIAAAAQRNRLGEAMSIEFAAPFLTELQRTAFRVGAREMSDYFGVVRPVGDNVALMTRRVSYDASVVTRLGKLDRHHNAGFVGVAFLGEANRIGDSAMIVSDTGLVSAPDATFGAAYPSFKVARVAAIAGFRSIHFMPVVGINSLSAQQDVGVGVQLRLLLGPSVWAEKGRGRTLAAGDLYAGVGSENSFVSAHFVSEARGDFTSPSWDGMVSSGRVSWYRKPSSRRTRAISLDFASIRHIDFPAQLTFRDVDGGVAGLPAARAAGGTRAVVRVEERTLVGGSRSRADVAVAAFADAGKLWAGDVPYGQTTVVRSSLGLSLLVAFPRHAKRTYRLDFAVPLNPERGGAKFALRFTALDRTSLLWLEPHDVSRLRTGAVASNIMRW